MTQHRPWFLLIAAAVASAQGVDSILLSDEVRGVAADPQGNLLVARQTVGGVAVFRYSPSGQLLNSFTGEGQMLPAGAAPVLACDPQGAIYMGSGSTILRPADSQNWTLQSTFAVNAIAFDAANNPVVGVADRSALPLTDTRVLKLDRNTGQILANRKVTGGYGASAIAIDGSGSVYVTGISDRLEGFAAKLDGNLQSLLYFIYLDAAAPHGLAVDSTGYAYIAETPLEVPSTFGPGGGGAIDFGVNTIYRIDPAGAIMMSAAGGGSAIAFDGSGRLIVTGGSYPPTGAFRTACGPRGDLGGLSITILDPSTLQLLSSAFLAQQTFLGASPALADGSLYVATQAGWVLHASPANPSSPVACIVNGASFLVENGIAPGQLLTIFGAGLGTDPITIYDDSQPLPFTSNGTEVRIGGFAAALLAVSSTQVNAIVPEAISQLDQSQPAAVEIVRDGKVIYTWPMNPIASHPTPLLQFDSTGILVFDEAPRYQDVLSTYLVPLADVWNADGTENSAANPAPVGSTVTIYATDLGVAPDGTIPLITPNGTLPAMISAIPGHSVAVLRVQATIPSSYSAGPLPFVLAPPANGTPVWTNFFYVGH